MTDREVVFEESLSDSWDEEDRGVKEVPLDDSPLVYVGVAISALAMLVLGQVIFLNVVRGNFYAPRAEANLGSSEYVNAPRGLITDRHGVIIAENRAVFSAFLDVREFLRHKELQEPTLYAIQDILGLTSEQVMDIIRAYDLERSSEPILLANDISQSQLVQIREKDLITFTVEDDFKRSYPEGSAFSTILGYVGQANKQDLELDKDLTSHDTLGKSGVERYYDDMLRGDAGIHVTIRDAKGNMLGEKDERLPKIGDTLALTIDAELQRYFYERFQKALTDLGRTTGAGLAINPQNGEILALVSFPSFDNNVFVTSGSSEERMTILQDKNLPLFNRIVAGSYNPASTIKPLVAVAALAEGVVTPERSVFSPGYLDVPNPYDPSNPSRFLDWRPQGDVNLYTGIAYSSNVYFYSVGGGANGIRGLGLDRLHTWWEKFGLGTKTGIDMPGEALGFLPTAEWKKQATGRNWFLGDTYNVSIGQGDLSITPLQLLSYIGAIANGGRVYAPHINSTVPVRVNADLREYATEISEVQHGMRVTVTDPRGTAHLMDTLPFEVSGKTGSAQIKNNQEENAFFVGYAPTANPQIAILILVENAKQGSLNAVPIAKDVLDWYHTHRLAK